jgi:hypothetical protein
MLLRLDNNDARTAVLVDYRPTENCASTGRQFQATVPAGLRAHIPY